MLIGFITLQIIIKKNNCMILLLVSNINKIFCYQCVLLKKLFIKTAFLLQQTVGETVGYIVRFENVATDQTKITYLTDGMLLRAAMADNFLMDYNVIILDEAHERTIHTDILFGIVKNAQKIRREKKVTPLKVLTISIPILFLW